MAQVSSGLKAAPMRIGDFNFKLENLIVSKFDVTVLEKAIFGLVTAVNQMQTKYKSVEERLDGIAKFDFSKIEQRLDDFDVSIKKCEEANVERIRKQREELGKELSSLAASNKGMDSRLADISFTVSKTSKETKQSIDEMDTRLGVLTDVENRMKSIDEANAQLDKLLAGHAERIKKLEGQDDSSEKKQMWLKLGDLETSSDTLSQKSHKVAGQLDAIEKQIQRFKTQFSDLEDKDRSIELKYVELADVKLEKTVFDSRCKEIEEKIPEAVDLTPLEEMTDRARQHVQELFMVKADVEDMELKASYDDLNSGLDNAQQQLSNMELQVYQLDQLARNLLEEVEYLRIEKEDSESKLVAGVNCLTCGTSNPGMGNLGQDAFVKDGFGNIGSQTSPKRARSETAREQWLLEKKIANSLVTTLASDQSPLPVHLLGKPQPEQGSDGNYYRGRATPGTDVEIEALHLPDSVRVATPSSTNTIQLPGSGSTARIAYFAQPGGGGGHTPHKTTLPARPASTTPYHAKKMRHKTPFSQLSSPATPANRGAMTERSYRRDSPPRRPASVAAIESGDWHRSSDRPIGTGEREKAQREYAGSKQLKRPLSVNVMMKRVAPPPEHTSQRNNLRRERPKSTLADRTRDLTATEGERVMGISLELPSTTAEGGDEDGTKKLPEVKDAEGRLDRVQESLPKPPAAPAQTTASKPSPRAVVSLGGKPVSEGVVADPPTSRTLASSGQ